MPAPPKSPGQQSAQSLRALRVTATRRVAFFFTVLPSDLGRSFFLEEVFFFMGLGHRGTMSA